MKKSKFFLSHAMLIIFGISIFMMYQCKGKEKGVTKEERQKQASLTSLFKVGEPIPLELINVTTNNSDSIGQFYYAELKLLTENSGVITLKSVENCKDEFLKFVIEPNGNTHVEGSTNSQVNDFIANHYTAWCSKWTRRNWRLCIGRECGNGIGICIQKRF